MEKFVPSDDFMSDTQFKHGYLMIFTEASASTGHSVSIYREKTVTREPQAAELYRNIRDSSSSNKLIWESDKTIYTFTIQFFTRNFPDQNTD